jgi:hypothetical protein
MILVDSNVQMYLADAVHPRKSDAQWLLEKLVSGHQRLVTRGVSFCPGEKGYDEVRMVPNAMVNRKPATVALCAVRRGCNRLPAFCARA